MLLVIQSLNHFTELSFRSITLAEALYVISVTPASTLVNRYNWSLLFITQPCNGCYMYRIVVSACMYERTADLYVCVLFLIDQAHKMYVLLTWNLDAWMFGTQCKLL